MAEEVPNTQILTHAFQHLFWHFLEFASDTASVGCVFLYCLLFDIRFILSIIYFLNFSIFFLVLQFDSAAKMINDKFVKKLFF